MAGEFDALRAITEELTGLAAVDTAFRRRINYAEEQLGQAESELINLRQIYAYLQAEIARKREVQRQLQREREQKDAK